MDESRGPRDAVEATIRRHALLRDTTHLLVGVSGGADSVALLHLLHGLVRDGRVRVDLTCVHCHHQLRGPDADADAAFVSDLARTIGIPCHRYRLPVRRTAWERRLSLETAGRDLRRAAFSELARELGAQAVATGHHRDDNAETLVFRLLRGTDLHGLAGIRPEVTFPGPLRWIHPLLPLSRATLRRYLREQGLTWREDLSNRDRAVARNRIRRDLLPTLAAGDVEALNGHLADLAARAGRLRGRVAAAAASLWDQSTVCASGCVSIPCPVFAASPPWLRGVWIRRAVTSLHAGLGDLRRAHYEAIAALATARGGPAAHSLPGFLRARRVQGRLCLERMPEPAVPPADVPLPVPGTRHWGAYAITASYHDVDASHTAQRFRAEAPQVVWLDAQRLTGPLRLRARRPGDRFTPLGRTRPCKVKTFLGKLGRRRARGPVVVLTDAERIVWVAPLRLSEAVRVTEGTRRLLRLELRHRPSQGEAQN